MSSPFTGLAGWLRTLLELGAKGPSRGTVPSRAAFFALLESGRYQCKRLHTASMGSLASSISTPELMPNLDQVRHMANTASSISTGSLISPASTKFQEPNRYQLQEPNRYRVNCRFYALWITFFCSSA